MYVAIEGIDGVGKTTQINLLKEKLKDSALFTKEPGGTDFGIKAREILLSGGLRSKRAELFLFLADRAEHFEEVIKPNLDRKTIISDRSFLSGIAYATASDSSLDIDFLIELNRFALQNTLPDRVILFKIDEIELVKRLNSREKDKIESRGYSYLMRIQKALKDTAEKIGLNYIEIDASLDELTIHKIILDYLEVKDF